jgi:type I restriction enzyme M protein
VIQTVKNLTKQDRITQEIIGRYNSFTKKQVYYEDHIKWLTERFPNGAYEDVIGLCKAATFKRY